MFKIKKLKPMFNFIAVTTDCYYRTGGIIDTSKANLIKEYQTVIEVGPMVKGIKPGDIIFINPHRYVEIKHHFKDADENNVQQDDMHAVLRIPQFTIYGKDGERPQRVMMLSDGDVYFVAEGEEFNPNPSIITEDKSKIILP